MVDSIVGAARAPEGTRPGAALARTNCASASLPGVHYSRNTSQGPSQLILEQQLMTTHLEFKRARVDALRVHACGCVYQARQRLAKGPLKRFDTDKRYFGVSRQPCTRNTKVIIKYHSIAVVTRARLCNCCIPSFCHSESQFCITTRRLLR